jgi:signal peptidase I
VRVRHVIAAAAAAFTLASCSSSNSSANPPSSQILTFTVPSNSMKPTLRTGDVAVVWKDAYRSASPQVGDIVVFHPSSNDLMDCADFGSTDLVKRIVALPGDRISSMGNSILVNGKRLQTHWKHSSLLLVRVAPQTLPPNTFFLVGDNYPMSCDSRVWGPIPGSDIIGKVLRWSPPTAAAND